MAPHQPALATITDQVRRSAAAGVLALESPRTVIRITLPARWRRERRAVQGINRPVLMASPTTAGTPRLLMNYAVQAKALGAQVRRGDAATQSVFPKRQRRRETDPVSGEEVRRAAPRAPRLRRCSTSTSIDDSRPLRSPRRREHSTRRGDARCTLVRIAQGIDDPPRRPPCLLRGRSRTRYPAAPGTELRVAAMLPRHAGARERHATGHKDRLDRFGGAIDDKARAREKLVAEIGSAFLWADLGIASNPRADHAAYIGSWIELLQDEPRAVFDAATKAQQAADFLHELARTAAVAGPPEPPLANGNRPCRLVAATGERAGARGPGGRRAIAEPVLRRQGADVFA